MSFEKPKGKWECKEIFGNFVIIDKKRNVVNINDTENNAKLMAFSPELLDAVLKISILDDSDVNAGENISYAINMCKKLINKLYE